MVEEEMARENDFVRHWYKIENYKNDDYSTDSMEDLRTLTKNYFY